MQACNHGVSTEEDSRPSTSGGPTQRQQCAFGQSTIAEFRYYLPPEKAIEYHLAIFFDNISTVFYVVDKPSFTSEWLLFKSSPEAASIPWMALLFAILSMALLGSCQSWPIDSTLDRISVEYELRAWDCLSQDHISGNHSHHGLKALMLIAYQRANRGLSIGSITRLAVRIARDLYPLNKCTIHPEEQKSIWNGLMTLCSLIYQLSKTPSEEVIPIASEASRIESLGMETFAMIYTRLDAISSEISQALCFVNPKDTYWLEARLEALQVHLEARKMACQPLLEIGEIHFLIIQGRLHYLFYHLFSAEPLYWDEVQRKKCLDSAKTVLYIFREPVLTNNQPIWWYLSGVGSLYAVKCASTLATYFNRNEWPVGQTEQIFRIMASQSRFCMDYMPHVQGDISFGV